MRRNYADRLPVIAIDEAGRAAPVEGVPENCWACDEFVARRRECRVLNNLIDDCFVLRQAKANAERGIEPDES